MIVATVAALATGGCGQILSSEDEESSRTKDQAVRVVPTFHLEGAEEVPEQLRLEDFGLAVSEIQLTPSNPDETVAYSSRQPMGLDFRVADGEIKLEGDELVLPESGIYDVSLRLEPATEASVTSTDNSRSYSMRIAGYVAGDGVVRVDPRSDGENSDGRPVPFPASPDRTGEDDEQVSDRPALPKQWTPFEYESKDSVVYTLDQVEIDGERQILSFSFDAEDWALELLEPLARAVQNNETPTTREPNGESVVDVTQEIDRIGEGPEGIEEHMSVQAIRPEKPDTPGEPGGAGF